MLYVGVKDELCERTKEYAELLTALGIEHQFTLDDEMEHRPPT